MGGKCYESVSELEADMKWFAHNCRTMFPRKSEVQNAAKQLVSFVKEEIQSILICAECYKNADDYEENSFVLPCENPHILIWAKAEGFIYWPAKAMTVVDGNSLNVRFFGDHATAVVSAFACYLYSEDNPNDSNDCDVELYNMALEVSFNFKDYIKLYLSQLFSL